jgi:DNA-binding transcriptional regulator YbjK
MHWKQRPTRGQAPADARDAAARRTERQIRREAVVAQGLRDLRSRRGQGAPTHQALAEYSGLPIGWLRWAYPSLEEVSG